MSIDESENSTSKWVKEISEANFADEVIEASVGSLVLVDFWAPWCGPCKTLSPVLAELVQTYGGMVRLVLVNVDDNQALASQMQIRSLPSVYMFLNGDVVDGFVGVISKQEILKKIETILQKSNLSLPNADAAKQWEQVELFLQEQKLPEAENALQQIVQTSAEDIKAKLLWAHLRLLQGLGNEEDIRQLLMQTEDSAEKDIESVKTSLEDLLKFDEEARATVAPEPALPAATLDLESLQQRVIVLVGERCFDEAIETLMLMIKEDASWQEGKARETLLQLLSAMGYFDKRVPQARLRLSNILFA